MLIGVENDPASWEAAGEGGLGCLFFFFFFENVGGIRDSRGPPSPEGTL